MKRTSAQWYEPTSVTVVGADRGTELVHKKPLAGGGHPKQQTPGRKDETEAVALIWACRWLLWVAGRALTFDPSGVPILAAGFFLLLVWQHKDKKKKSCISENSQMSQETLPQNSPWLHLLQQPGIDSLQGDLHRVSNVNKIYGMAVQCCPTSADECIS